ARIRLSFFQIPTAARTFPIASSARMLFKAAMKVSTLAARFSGWLRQMADLFFPQLSNGAIGQYPIRKTKVTRTVKNVMQDGRVISYADPNGAQLVWQLGYAALSFQDLDLLVAHFNSCQGRLHA